MTDQNGVYAALFLVPGTYEVQVTLQGFKSWVRSDLVLQVNDRLRIDASLEVGGIEERTTVLASSPVVRTDSSEVGTVIEETAIKELPLNGRNFATLVYLVPGITPGQAGENLSGASTFNPRGASNFNALGHQANSNAWLVDGIDNNEFTFNTVIVAPSVEQTREFKVLSGVFPAEFGRGAGVVSVSTKAGTNQLHGTVFEYLRNDAFDARNFFVRKRTGPDGSLIKDPVPPLNRHQFGGALGGALVIPGLYDGHDRTFFFGDYAGIKERRGVTTVNTVPSAAARIGDFSNYRDRNGNLIPIYDPLTTRFDATGRVIGRDPFPNNIIPANRIHEVGRNIASIYPLPNNGSGNFDNYISTPDREITDHAYSGRVDHRFTDNDSVFVRFNYGKFSLDAPQGQANCCLPTPADAAARFDLGPFVAGIQNTRLTTHGAAFNYSKVLTPTFVNELRIGYAKTNPFTTQSDYGLNSASSLGIQGINVSEITTGLPNIDITNFTGISGGPAFLPVNPSQWHYQIENALVWIKGRHQMKFGYRLVDRAPSPMIHDNTRSLITFGTSFVNNPVTNTGGTGLAEVLLGYFNSASRGFLLEVPTFSVVEQSAFVQDDFKVNSRLTVNAGLRYEIFHAPTEEQDRMGNFDYQTYTLVYAGENGATRSANKKTRYNNVAPRLGVTYGLTDDMRTVLRTGFGITYFPSPYAAGNLNHLNVPFTISQNVSHQTNPLDFSLVRTIDNPFPPIVPVKPETTAALNAANPRVIGHGYSNETAYAEQWHLGVERQLFSALLVEAEYRRQRRQAPHPLLQPERDPAGVYLERVAPAPAAHLEAQQHTAVRSPQPFDVPRRDAESATALLERPAVPRQLHLRQVARLRRRGGQRRRRSGRRPDGHRHGGLARSIRLRRAPPWRRELRLRAAVWEGPALDVRQRCDSRRHRRRLAAVGHHDDDDGTAVHGLPEHRRQQRRAELAQPYRSGHARQSVSGHVVQSGRLRGAAGQHLRRLGTRDPVRARARQLRHVALEAVRDRWTYQPRVPVGRVQPVQPPGIRVPEPEHRQRQRRAYHHDDCRQPEHAVCVEAELLNRSATARGANAPRAAALKRDRYLR